MFDKLFLSLANKVNTVNAFDKMCDKVGEKMNRRLLDKATVRYTRSGNRIIDSDVMTAGHMKRWVALVGFTMLAGIAANKLGAYHERE